MKSNEIEKVNDSYDFSNRRAISENPDFEKDI